jgi:predicted ArsR family transcriptional regulator
MIGPIKADKLLPIVPSEQILQLVTMLDGSLETITPTLRRSRTSEVGRSQKLRIIHMLKRSRGLAVAEIASRLGLSYMGAKQHCAELEKQGVLDTWRRPKAQPKPVGRPELVYRLTAKAGVFFPAQTNVSTIDVLNASRQLFGVTASDKLLLALFRKKAEAYAHNMQGITREARAESLARLRDAEGHLSQVVRAPDLMIQEYHSLILDLVDAFPLVRRLEKEMFETLLGASVERHEERTSGLYLCTFSIN